MLKMMKLWNGRSFYFHSSQEQKLLQKELNAETVLLKYSDGNTAKYQNKDIPAFSAQTITCENQPVNYEG